MYQDDNKSLHIDWYITDDESVGAKVTLNGDVVFNVIKPHGFLYEDFQRQVYVKAMESLNVTLTHDDVNMDDVRSSFEDTNGDYDDIVKLTRDWTLAVPLEWREKDTPIYGWKDVPKYGSSEMFDMDNNVYRRKV